MATEDGTFGRLVEALSELHRMGDDVAPFFWLGILLGGAVLGGCVAVWIFRGGLGRQFQRDAN